MSFIDFLFQVNASENTKRVFPFAVFEYENIAHISKINAWTMIMVCVEDSNAIQPLCFISGSQVCFLSPQT